MNGPRAGVGIGTIVAGNFLAFARVLASSLHQHHPDLPLHVVLVDGPGETPDAREELFELVSLDDIGMPDLPRRRFAYTRQELVVAAKPFLLRYLLARGFSTAVFLDADILVVDGLEPLLAEAAAHAVSLTPHLLDPPAADRVCRELNILRSGVYNGGFVAVSRSACADRFLSWWADRLQTHCRHAPDDGMHYDQRWLDLAPGLFDDVHIVRDRGCNVAYWNLPERRAPFRFFHFSGFDPARPGVVTRYSDRVTMDSAGAALFRRYADLLAAAGHEVSSRRPYAFGSFDNGIAIPLVARRLYDGMGTDAEKFGDPFHTGGSDSFFRWLTAGAGLPPLWTCVHRSRSDLQRRFPDPSGSDLNAFRTWILEAGLAEHDIDAALAP